MILGKRAAHRKTCRTSNTSPEDKERGLGSRFCAVAAEQPWLHQDLPRTPQTGAGLPGQAVHGGPLWSRCSQPASPPQSQQQHLTSGQQLQRERWVQAGAQAHDTCCPFLLHRCCTPSSPAYRHAILAWIRQALIQAVIKSHQASVG